MNPAEQQLATLCMQTLSKHFSNMVLLRIGLALVQVCVLKTIGNAIPCAQICVRLSACLTIC